jgi:hypothetical protein
LVQIQTQVEQGGAFAVAVADLARDGEVLLVEIDGPAVVVQVVVGGAEVAQSRAFKGALLQSP